MEKFIMLKNFFKRHEKHIDGLQNNWYEKCAEFITEVLNEAIQNSQMSVFTSVQEFLGMSNSYCIAGEK